MEQVRLYFEPNPGVCVNHTPMFEHYVMNWLSDHPVEFGGYIAMDALEKKHGSSEPVYQVVCDEPYYLEDLMEYAKHEPLEGYTVHVYIKEDNNNNLRKLHEY